MGPDHAEVWLQTPPAPIQNIDTGVEHPSPHHEQKVASDDLLLLGMLIWMEQGLTLEWLQPGDKKKVEEEKNVGNLEGKADD